MGSIDKLIDLQVNYIKCYGIKAAKEMYQHKVHLNIN